MADLVLATGRHIQLVGYDGSVQRGHIPTGVAVTEGQALILDPTTRKLILADASAAPTARVYGIALTTQPANFGITVVRFGILDGYDLDGLDIDDVVFLSDTAGALADAAGTVSVPVGRVIPATATLLGTAYDKLLEVELV